MKLIPIIAVALPLALAGFAQSSTQTTTEQRTESHSSRTVTSDHWRGMLVDANCAAAGSQGAATTRKHSTDTSLNTNESANSTDRAAARSESSSSRSESHSERTVSPEGTVTSSESHRESSRTTNSADRSADANTAGTQGEMSKWQGCPVTVSTTSYGVVFNDGHLVRLEDDANAMQSFRNTRKFTRAEASGHPARVDVRGTLEGNTLKLESIR